MGAKRQKCTRRDFIRGAATAALASTASFSAFCQREPRAEAEEPPKKPAPEPKPSDRRAGGVKSAGGRAKVVLIRDEHVLDAGRKTKAEVIARMLDRGVATLLGQSRPQAAWASLVKPKEVVGIKSNVWRFLPTPPELERAIAERLIGAGVAKDSIAVDDRGVLNNPLFERATALINVRPLRTHHWSGVGSCIKNYIMFAPAPFLWHGDSCADLARLWELPVVKDKTRLNIAVMLTPLFHGKGPHHYQAKYTWDYKGLLIGTDPVAVDATGVRILQAKRTQFFGNDQPFSVSPKHIRLAEQRHGLGIADPARIDVIKLGWMEEALI